MLETSPITGKTYDTDRSIYVTNMLQAQRYLEYLGPDYLYDILWTSTKRQNALVFVFSRCPETKKAKTLWDNHEL